MAINNNDVNLFERKHLADEENGDSRLIGRHVIDGNVNNLFQDISRIDCTVGDVALRKAFVGINIDNNDTYLGSHLILTEQKKREKKRKKKRKKKDIHFFQKGKKRTSTFFSGEIYGRDLWVSYSL